MAYLPTPEEAGGWPLGVLISEYWRQKARLDEERRAAAGLSDFVTGDELWESVQALSGLDPDSATLKI